jgi:hypothetical protein
MHPDTNTSTAKVKNQLDSRRERAYTSQHFVVRPKIEHDSRARPTVSSTFTGASTAVQGAYREPASSVSQAPWAKVPSSGLAAYKRSQRRSLWNRLRHAHPVRRTIPTPPFRNIRTLVRWNHGPIRHRVAYRASTGVIAGFQTSLLVYSSTSTNHPISKGLQALTALAAGRFVPSFQPFRINTTLVQLYIRARVLAPTTLSACKQSLLARVPFQEPLYAGSCIKALRLARPGGSAAGGNTETLWRRGQTEGFKDTLFPMVPITYAVFLLLLSPFHSALRRGVLCTPI